MRVCSYFFLVLGVVAIMNSCGSEKGDPSQAPEEAMEEELIEPERPKKIVFFGNSLTAAFGLDPQDGFTALIQRKLAQKDASFKVINAGISGDTAKEGKERVHWVLQQRIDYFILELGLNDIFQGASTDQLYQDLSAIIQKVQAEAPETAILLTELELPAALSAETRTDFKALYPRLAKAHDITLIPGFLEGVLDKPSLNLPDGLHPNAEGQVLMAEQVWRVLEPML
ncbi:MAG: arylesterase [Saprospiraceae bacterium]|nr:arylesterase [Saprospiraceae bacterium]